MIAMPVRDHQIVDLALRNQTLDVTADPLAATLHRTRLRRHVAHVLGMMRVAAVKEHRRSVRKDKERLFADTRVNEVDVQLARLPLRTGLSALIKGAASRHTPCQRMAQKATTCHFRNISMTGTSTFGLSTGKTIFPGALISPLCP